MFEVSTIRPTTLPMRPFFVACLAFLLGPALIARADVVTYPAPEGETLSSDYTVLVDGKPVPVYLAKTQHHEKSRTRSPTLISPAR